jgi:hypothetical protein
VLRRFLRSKIKGRLFREHIRPLICLSDCDVLSTTDDLSDFHEIRYSSYQRLTIYHIFMKFGTAAINDCRFIRFSWNSVQQLSTTDDLSDFHEIRYNSSSRKRFEWRRVLKNRPRDRVTSVKSVNTFLRVIFVRWPICVKFHIEGNAVDQLRVISKLVQGRPCLFKVLNKVLPCFQMFTVDLDNIWCWKCPQTLLRNCEFRENRRCENPVIFRGINWFVSVICTACIRFL